MGNMDIMSNNVTDRGENKWMIVVYEPKKIVLGPFVGALKISKDHHFITDKHNKCLINVANQNVAFVTDFEYLDEYGFGDLEDYHAVIVEDKENEQG